MKTPLNKSWLPTTAKEIKSLGWSNADVILFTGDAYVDHPSFGAAVIGRFLEKAGYKVAIIPQPNWQDDLRDFKKLGKPNLFFGVTAGAMDSMVNHYTASRRLRSDDSYTPGGRAGQRPDYPTIVYTNILKKLFPEVPVILGGIEASLRRFTHYDYWKDDIEPSVLFPSKADMVVYGMGEQSILAITNGLKSGQNLSDLHHLPQIVYLSSQKPENKSCIELPGHEACRKTKTEFARAFRLFEEETNKGKPLTIIQKTAQEYVISNPPWPVPTEEVTDSFYDLPFTRLPHPRYHKKPPIPAYEMIKFSVNMHRGCFGGCSFCAISAHQGKFVASRSKESILKELKVVASHPEFKGHISDLGGPSANMYQMKGKDIDLCEKCKRPSCIYPSVCRNLNTSHKYLNEIYTKAENLNGINKISIGSGIRYDLLLKSFNKNAGKEENQYVENLILKHVSGRLKVAPEHTEETTLKLMRKPSYILFEEFRKKFQEINERHKLNQQIIPYFISAHPGTSFSDMQILYKKTRSVGFRLEQVQLFTPTPMTLSSVIYHTGINPYDQKPVYIAKTDEKRKQQHEAFFSPQNSNKGKSIHKKSKKTTSTTKQDERPFKRRHTNKQSR